MALVALCRHFRDHVDSKINFKAFIVDHGLRHKSAEEAAQVCEDVYNLGIEAEVLKVRVPIGEDGGVETVARNRRYGALEVAFRKGGISVGLTGHHQDDAVETFFLRIAQNSSGIHLASLGAFVPNTGLKHGCVASGAIDSERFVLDEYEQQCG